MEENESISIWNINNMILRIILREHNLIFMGKREKFGDQGGMSGLPGGSKSCRRNNFSFEQLDV
jgi:hypothetical protein